MANRGLNDEEVAYAKRMILMNMRRDVIHSFFVTPANPISPAFVSELSSGLIGRGIEPASEELTLAFIRSRTVFGNRTRQRTTNQPDLFPEPPTDLESPHRFTWDDSRLVTQGYENYSVRSDNIALALLSEAREELDTLSSDTALGNHPRFLKRVSRLSEYLNQDIANIDPILAGARAKLIMRSISYSKDEFSDEFIGEVSAATGAVIMFASHFEAWRQYELQSMSVGEGLTEAGYEIASDLIEDLRNLPTALVDPSVPESLSEFLERSRARLSNSTDRDIELSVEATLRASVSYAALSTISQFLATIIREMRDAGRQATISAQPIAEAIRSGALKAVETGTRIITSSVIVVSSLATIRLIVEQNQSILGWALPFLDMIEKQLLSKD